MYLWDGSANTFFCTATHRYSGRGCDKTWYLSNLVPIPFTVFWHLAIGFPNTGSIVPGVWTGSYQFLHHWHNGISDEREGEEVYMETFDWNIADGFSWGCLQMLAHDRDGGSLLTTYAPTGVTGCKLKAKLWLKQDMSITSKSWPWLLTELFQGGVPPGQCSTAVSAPIVHGTGAGT